MKDKMIHTGEKPYKFCVCGKGCIQQIDLIRHKKTHTRCCMYVKKMGTYLNIKYISVLCPSHKSCMVHILEYTI